MTELLTPKELSIRWKISTSTLARWRAHCVGPAYVTIGHNIRYRIEDVIEFETAADKKESA